MRGWERIRGFAMMLLMDGINMDTDSPVLMVVTCLIPGFALVCLFLVLVFVENNKLCRAPPLYEIDILGLLLLSFLLMLIIYVVVYGKVDSWWESSSITTASILIPMMLLAFVARELIFDRPLLTLGDLKKLIH